MLHFIENADAENAENIILEEDITLKDKIGKGNFGTVYTALWKGMQVAIKEIILGYGKPDLREVELCRYANHR